MSDFEFRFDNSYARELAGCYVPWRADRVPAPRLVAFNAALAAELGLPAGLDSPAGAALLCGMDPPAGAQPLAQAYAGHQFGAFSPQLGDGRALLLGEVIDPRGRRFDLHLKGSGATPFSRGGDGKAVLGPVLREYLVAEAMHALGIPTTRALAALTTGEAVRREGLKPGAVLARVAASHLRVGTLQFFAARDEHERLRRVADYAIARHDPDLVDRDDRYLAFLARVIDRQAALVAQWMAVGFVHGVMNTDNMTLSGETIDYGPCAFMDHYDPATVFSSIDRHGRYAYGNQPAILQWNLARLAEALLPLIDPDDPDRALALAVAEIEAVPERYRAAWLARMRAKLGLASAEAGDGALVDGLFAALEGQGVDFTLFFRHLARAAEGDELPLLALFDNARDITAWLLRWRERLLRDPQEPAARVAAMNRVNPLYIPRNHLVEAALQAAEAEGDLGPFRRLLDVLADPYTERPGLDDYARPAPDDFGPYVTFCGT